MEKEMKKGIIAIMVILCLGLMGFVGFMKFSEDNTPPECISVGNPHCVTVVEDVDSLKLEAIGPAFEHHANFPERINTEFVQVVDAAHLKMRVWERGSGETWACGTGTCATVAALTELGICPAGQDIHVQLRGGELVIRVLPGRQLLMTGSAVTVYEGVAEV